MKISGTLLILFSKHRLHDWFIRDQWIIGEKLAIFTEKKMVVNAPIAWYVGQVLGWDGALNQCSGSVCLFITFCFLQLPSPSPTKKDDDEDNYEGKYEDEDADNQNEEVDEDSDEDEDDEDEKEVQIASDVNFIL